MTDIKISAQDVNKLRQMTGAGMMDCKKALEATGGDFDAAIDELRKRGMAKAAKREDRDAKEGVAIAMTLPNQTRGIIVALNCETDFVARNESFIAMTQKMADIALDNFPENLEELLSLEYEPGVSIRDKAAEQTGVIGEKVELSRYERITGAQVLPYNHSNNKLAVLVAINKRENEYEEAARNVAMQIAAMSPIAVNQSDISQAVIDKEIEIGRELARNEGKPEHMLEGIAKGRLNAFFRDFTLLNQKYVKDNNLSIAQYLQGLNKELTVSAFHRVAI